MTGRNVEGDKKMRSIFSKYGEYIYLYIFLFGFMYKTRVNALNKHMKGSPKTGIYSRGLLLNDSRAETRCRKKEYSLKVAASLSGRLLIMSPSFSRLEYMPDFCCESVRPISFIWSVLYPIISMRIERASLRVASLDDIMLDCNVLSIDLTCFSFLRVSFKKVLARSTVLETASSTSGCVLFFRICLRRLRFSINELNIAT